MPWLAIATRPDMRDLDRLHKGATKGWIDGLDGDDVSKMAYLRFQLAKSAEWRLGFKSENLPDDLLSVGSLGSIHSSFWLATISKYSVYSKLGWQPWKVERAASRARPFEKYGLTATTEQRRFYESAAAFLRVCADLGLGVRFSW